MNNGATVIVLSKFRWTSLALVALVLLNCPLHPAAGAAQPGDMAALTQAAYVWQRAWTPEVQAAVRAGWPGLTSFVVLAAQVDWQDNTPRVVRVRPDFGALKESGAAVGLALRVTPYPRALAANGPAVAMLAELCAALVAEARAAGVEPAELQIDYDCAASRLAEYRGWLQSLRQTVAPVPVTFTALPAWLDSPEFAGLARAADGFVLQVHSLTRPQSAAAPASLCAPDAARRAVARASALSVPFRVALPTYGYLVAFSATGACLGVSAEGPLPNWPAAATVRELRADAEEMLALQRDWSTVHAATLKGIIWYRLPVVTDTLNWHRRTFLAVLAGETPRPALRVEAAAAGDRLWDIVFRNDGNADAALPRQVSLTWTRGEIVASDALAGFTCEPGTSQSLLLRSSGGGSAPHLRPDERRVAAWLRLSEPAEVQVHVSP